MSSRMEYPSDTPGLTFAKRLQFQFTRPKVVLGD